MCNSFLNKTFKRFTRIQTLVILKIDLFCLVYLHSRKALNKN